MSMLNKKREREACIITLGHIPKGGYYYISDTITEGNKIKIPIETPIIPEDPPLILTEIKKNLNTPIFLPSCSSWFNFDNINEIEINALPEFFCGKFPSKTKEIYKNYRNFIINLYRENPKKYLTSTTCRKHLAGDGCSILRIHAFLEHWGLINFKVEDNFIKPNNGYLPKAFNFKSPVYIDTSFLMGKNLNNNNFGNNKNKIDNNNINLSNSNVGIEDINNNNFNNVIDNVNNGNNNIENNNNLNSNNSNQKKILYPLNNHSENIYRKYFSENQHSVNHQINFLTKNYRPKCDLCNNLCELDWYITKENPFKNLIENNLINDENKSKMLLICENCYEKGEFILGLNKDDFELSNVYNIFSNDKFNGKLKEKLENEKWTDEENKMLLDAIKKYGDGNWDEIAKVFNNKKTKLDCIIHLLEYPLKKNLTFENNNNDVINNNNMDIEKKENVEKNDNNNKNEDNKDEDNKRKNEDIKDKDNNKKDINNDLNEQNENDKKDKIEKVVFFSKMFEKYVGDDKKNNDLEKTKNLKDIIYKTYAKSIIKSNELKNEEKEEMKRIMDYLIYLQMKKVEMKLKFFSDFDRLIKFHKNKFKSTESQLIQDRFKLTEQKAEILSIVNQVKDVTKGNNEINNINTEKIEIDHELRLLHL